MKLLVRACVCVAVFLWLAPSARAGWVIERSTRTEGASGPSSEETLYIANGRVKEVHPDGTYFLWDVPRGLLFQVDPRAKTYSGGPVKKMVAEVRKYLDELRDRLAHLSDEEREELARHTQGMPVPVPPPTVPPRWTVKETSRTTTVVGRTARLFEIYRDGTLFEETWIAPVEFGRDLDYPRYAAWSGELESSFTSGMGGSSPAGKDVDALYARGFEMKTVLLGDNVRVVTEVTRLEKRDIPDSTFHLPADYILKGAQLS